MLENCIDLRKCCYESNETENCDQNPAAVFTGTIPEKPNHETLYGPGASLLFNPRAVVTKKQLKSIAKRVRMRLIRSAAFAICISLPSTTATRICFVWFRGAIGRIGILLTTDDRYYL